MHNISVLGRASSQTLSVTRPSRKYIFQSMKLSCLFVNHWRASLPTSVKLVCRASSSFCQSSGSLPFLLEYQCCMKPHVCNKKKPKVDLNLSHAVKKFSSRSSCSLERIHNDSEYFSDHLPYSITPVAPTPDDIQVKFGGTVKCQDKNSVITIFNLNSIKSLSSLNTDDCHTAFRNSSSKKGTESELSIWKLNNLIFQAHVVNFADSSFLATNNPPSHSAGNPIEEHLTKISNKLSLDLPNLFVKVLDYGIYSNDLIFENRINGTRTVGIGAYIRQVNLLRIIGHFKYAFVKLDILKITKHSEDSTIRVRWRISGLSALKSFGLIWRLKTLASIKNKDQLTHWHDGFSVFHVGSDGLVYKHVADKMMPDEEFRVEKKQSLLTKLASLVNVAPKPSPQSAMTSTELSSNKINSSFQKKDIVSIDLGVFSVC